MSKKPRPVAFRVSADDVVQAIEKWCPYEGKPAVTVRFKMTWKLVCLACGLEH
jgi:hypothetical protein